MSAPARPTSHVVPAGAVAEWRRQKDRLCAVDGQLRPLVAGPPVLAAALCAQFREVDAFQTLGAPGDSVIANLTQESQMPIERFATDAELGLFGGAPFLAKLLDRQALISHRLAVVLVDVETKEIDEFADVLLAQQTQVQDALILDHEFDEQTRNALCLPLRLFIPMIVGGILLSRAFRKLQEIGHGNELRDGRRFDLRRIVVANHGRTGCRRNRARRIVPRKQ